MQTRTMLTLVIFGVLAGLTTARSVLNAGDPLPAAVKHLLPSSPTLRPLWCNQTMPCDAKVAICDDVAYVCLCLTNSTQSDRCLPSVDRLGDQCLVSAQCRPKHSACYNDDFKHWSCRCGPGFRAQQNNTCIEEQISNAEARGCPQPGQLWVPALGRCVSSNIAYAYRFGRAGGSRGGVGTNVGGRGTGSRSWYSSSKEARRNVARPVESILGTFGLALMTCTIWLNL